MSTPNIKHFVDEHGNFVYRAEFEGSFLSKDEAKELGKYVSGILAENHRLRELVSDMLHWMPCQRPCQRCERRYPEGCEFEIRWRKLGVDDG